MGDGEIGDVCIWLDERSLGAVKFLFRWANLGNLEVWSFSIGTEPRGFGYENLFP